MFRPEIRPFSEARLEQLSLPAGFRISVYASELEHARMLAVHYGYPEDIAVLVEHVAHVIVRNDADGVACSCGENGLPEPT